MGFSKLAVRIEFPGCTTINDPFQGKVSYPLSMGVTNFKIEQEADDKPL